MMLDQIKIKCGKYFQIKKNNPRTAVTGIDRLEFPNVIVGMSYQVIAESESHSEYDEVSIFETIVSKNVPVILSNITTKTMHVLLERELGSAVMVNIKSRGKYGVKRAHVA